MKPVVLIRLSALVLFSLTNLFAQSYNASIEKKVNYRNWGAAWDTIYILKNEIVTLAILPKIGGRIMQYDLKDHQSIYIEENAKNIVPADGNAFIGGYRTLPSPQSDFTWPPPPALDFKPYICKRLNTGIDSTVVYLESQIENNTGAKYTKHKGLQLKKTITMYKSSTRVKVTVTMLNQGSTVLKHGIWDITQSDCSHNGTTDNKNFWVYFKRNPASTLGGGKGYVQYMNEGTDNSQWRPDAAAGGIMGVQYLKKTAKIGADCKAGWIAFVDQLDGYAYIKKFTYENGREYPDSGASVQVYTYSNRNVTEVEVQGPLVSLDPGDSTTMVENWFCARSKSAVLDVNDAGIITTKLISQQTDDSLDIEGTYGIFYPGTVRASFVNKSVTIMTVDSFMVSPFDSLKVSKKYKIPQGALSLRLDAFNSSGALIGLLDSTTIPNPAGTIQQERLQRFTPLKNSTVTVGNHHLRIGLHTPGKYNINLFNAQGQLIRNVKGIVTSTPMVDIPLSSNGTLILQIVSDCGIENRMIYTLR